CVLTLVGIRMSMSLFSSTSPLATLPWTNALFPQVARTPKMEMVLSLTDFRRRQCDASQVTERESTSLDGFGPDPRRVKRSPETGLHWPIMPYCDYMLDPGI